MSGKKINLLLFILLGILLTFTYLFEEISQNEKREKVRVESELFPFSKLGEVESISLGQHSILIENGKYFALFDGVKKQLDEGMVIHLLDSLAEIRTRRILTEEEAKSLDPQIYNEDDKFKFSFKFAKEEDVFIFTLGKKVQYSKDFYMSMLHKGKRNVMIAYNDVPLTRAHTHQEGQLSSEPYQKIKTLLYLDPIMLIDKSLFLANSDWLTCQEVIVKRRGQRDFKVNFKESTTFPEPYPSLSYNKNLMFEWRKAISIFKALEVRSKVIFKAEVQAELICDQTIRLKIYRQNGEYIASHNKSDNFFVLSDKARELFFINEQTFWILVPKIDLEVSQIYNAQNREVALPDYVKTIIGQGADFVLKPDKFDQKEDKVMATLKSQNMTLHFTSRGSDIIMKDEKNKIWFFYLQKLAEWKKNLP